MTETITRETPYFAVRRLYQVHGYNSDAITQALFEEFALSDAAREFFGGWVRDRVANALVGIEHRPPAGSSRGTSASRRSRGTRRVSQKRSQSSSASQTKLAFLDYHVPGTIDGTTGRPKLVRHCTVADFAERERVFCGHKEAAAAQERTYAWAQSMLKSHRVRTLDDLDSEVILAELPEEGVRF